MPTIGRMRVHCILTMAVLASLAFPAVLGAQPAPNPATAPPWTPEMARDLPTDGIATGILYDRVVPFSRIGEYDGSATSPPATLRAWRQLYFEIRGAALQAMTWPDLNILGARLRPAVHGGAIPILMMNFLYDKIRADALESGALSIRNGKLEPGAGDLFETHRVFAAAPWRECVYDGADVVFRIDPANYFSNDPRAPLSLEVDFDDGKGFVPVALQEDRHIHYTEPGPKRLHVRLSLFEGSVLHSGFSLDVRALQTPLPDETIPLEATIPFEGVTAQGTAYVSLAPSHEDVTDPIVLIEGFDPDNKNGWEEIYELLSRENVLGTLQDDGFDLVVLDFSEGGDYIQRNAFLAVELFALVQERIGAGRDFAVVGASMGGLVGRYAIRYMELEGLEPPIHTYLTFDSPHRGANIPLGMQYFLSFFAEYSDGAAEGLAKINSPAARQMLLYHYEVPAPLDPHADALRDALIGDFAAIGDFPIGPRLVAVANGSGAGAGQEFGPGDQIFDFQYFTASGDAFALPDHVQGMYPVFFGSYGVPQLEVYCTDTDPLDSAPGGWYATMDTIATGGPDPDAALQHRHCFIPTTSALAIGTNDVMYDIAGDPDLLTHTPFDIVHYPHGSNQEHVSINSENAPWLLGELSNHAPLVNANGPYEGTVGELVQFSGLGSSDPDGDTVSYKWQFGDGSTSVDPNPAHAFALEGTYTVTLRVKDAQGRATTEFTSATITSPGYSPEPPAITLTAPNNETADDLVAVTWIDDDPDNNAAILLYRDNNSSGYDGTCLNPGAPLLEDDTADYFAWNTSSLPEGRYWVYAEITDGTTTVRDYSPGYVDIDHPDSWDTFDNDGLDVMTDDGDVYAEPGEPVDMEIRIRNLSSTQTLKDVWAHLSTTNPHVTITDNEHYFGDFSARQFKWSEAFDWYAESGWCGPVQFELRLDFTDASGHPYYDVAGNGPSVTVYCQAPTPSFSVREEDTIYRDIGAHCDRDGALNSGESWVRYLLRLRNDGQGLASQVWVEVQDPGIGGVQLHWREAAYGNLSPGEITYPQSGDSLSITVNARSFAGPIPMNLLVHYNDGQTATVPFQLYCVAAPWIDFPELNLNFGAREPSVVDTVFTVVNEGSADLVLSGIGATPMDMTVAPPAPVTISAGDSLHLQVVIDGSDDFGSWTGQIDLTHNSHMSTSTAIPVFGVFSPPTPPYGLDLVQTLDTSYEGTDYYDEINDLALGNFDNDPELEIATVTDYSWNGSQMYRSALVIWDQGGGGWQRAWYNNAPGVVEATHNLVVGDLDNDGRDEIVVASRPYATAGVPNGAIYVYDFTGTYSLANTLLSNSYWKDGVTIGDRDQNGHREIVAFEKDASNPTTQAALQFFEQTSGLSFSHVWTSPNLMTSGNPPTPADHIAGLTIADADGDGVKETTCLSHGGFLYMYEGNSLVFTHTPDDPGACYHDYWHCDTRCDLKIKDTDRDGRPELLIITDGIDRLLVIESTGNNTFNWVAPSLAEDVLEKEWVIADDLDQDGYDEIIALGERGGGPSPVEIFENFADNAYQRVFTAHTSEFIASDILAGGTGDCPAGNGRPRELVCGPQDSFINIYAPSLGAPADLVVFDGAIACQGMLVENTELSVQYSVVNSGAYDVTGALMRAYDGVPGAPGTVVIGEQSVPLIAAGQTVPGEFAWTPALAGNHDIHVLADPDSAITEGDETNNEGHLVVAIADDDTEGPEISGLDAVEENGDGDGIIESTEQIRVRCSVIDGSGVASVTCRVDELPTIPLALSGDLYEGVLDPLAVGGHELRIDATDADNSPAASFLVDSLYVARGNHPPVVEHPIADLAFAEDTMDSTIVLNAVFSDEDEDPLVFTVGGNTHVSVEIRGDSKVFLRPELDWHGAETIVFTADDQYGAMLARSGLKSRNVEALDNAPAEKNDRRMGAGGQRAAVSDTVVVTVLPVNDAPIVYGLPDSLALGGEGWVELNIWPYVRDAESADGELEYAFDDDPECVSASYDPGTGLVRFTAESGFESTVLTVTATDPEQATGIGAFVLLGIPDTSIVVTVHPLAATVTANQTQRFTAGVTGTPNHDVTWSVDGGAGNGTITSDGLYTAPGEVPYPPMVTVRATSVEDPTKSGTAIVTVVEGAFADWARVPAGVYTMGDGSWSSACGYYQRQVTLTHDCDLGQYEVTNQQYLEMVQWAYDHGYVTATATEVRDNLDGSTALLVNLGFLTCELQFADGQFSLRDVGHGLNPDHPMKVVTWYGSAAYCDWLSMKESCERAYNHQTWQCNEGSPYTAVGYRLPTEAEWEYAAQYNDERTYPWGNETPDCSRANYRSCVAWTSPVGSYPAEKIVDGKALYDMAGNVLEWVNDWFECNLGTSAQTDPTGPTTGTKRLFRGGSWGAGLDYELRCSYRAEVWSRDPGNYFSDVGFRCIRTYGLVAVTVEPESIELPAGMTQQFTATVTGTTNQAVTWAVDGGDEYGTISSSGLYTAPEYTEDPLNVTIRATSQADPRVSGTASVTVRPQDVSEGSPGNHGTWFWVSPNPTAGPLQIRFASDGSQPVSLTIHDVAGRIIASLATSQGKAGEQSATWDGRDTHGRSVPSGLYLVVMRGRAAERTTRVLVVR